MHTKSPSRYPSRSTTDSNRIYEVLDQGLFCTVAYVNDGIAHQIPTGYLRMGDHIYIHGSVKSHFIDSIFDKNVSFSVTIMDGLVLAPTAFDHSFNYRSVIGFSLAKEIVDVSFKQKLLCEFTERYIPGRIADIGEPNANQVAATRIVELSISDSMAKMRTGEAGGDVSTTKSWCGVIPIQTIFEKPILNQEVILPSYLEQLIHSNK